ncbi:MAG: gliding motility-associated C-terminal domain-containing protein [Chitinophagaceae bacterium]|nr:gliding motility-associated C-terminal domain-containing protein [Chitinophagaceae bacterium]MCA6453080.1 gliding motility-associated C-terminal domain-containing protein [Chitinophagaceae bacterium]MCA6454556.1 gliding motility-associated C-terminal domain-containing protein [Chitinophagaceae bacterium]MCA6457496.1 gliding motility-associated C-terminal domain-containing protein [Chitinophagaceae bacterium]MCA6463210.1 gliding motility-associated C-terminal domain-containing protein [Chitin
MDQRFFRAIQLLLIQACLLLATRVCAQCPANIGFESGDFTNWECKSGSIGMNDGKISLQSTAPTDGRHTIIKSGDPTLLDTYGGFPMSCPNGSGYSIQLGNPGTGRMAEQVSYTFTIPANQNNYSLIYNYAVVFQNPGHADWEQPKFTANVFDVTKGDYIGCSSFSYAAASGLPGFKQSPFKDSVFYKTWTPVTIKLSGYAGRTIRIEFTTNDCTRGGHFGYAYVDVNENCSSPVSGNVQCISDSTQVLTAPFGFAGYRWFTSDFSKLLGTSGTLSFSPPPAPNTTFAVEVTPYPDQGCVDTVYTTIEKSPEIIQLKTPTAPIAGCVNNGVDLTAPLITAGSTPGLNFEYFTDPAHTQYVAIPKKVTSSGTYYIRATNNAGCTSTRPVVLNMFNSPGVTMTNPIPTIRPTLVNLYTAIGGDTSGIKFSFWKDAQTTIPVADPKNINRSGIYYIKGVNEGGCSLVAAVEVLVNDPPLVPPNAFSPNGDGVHDYWEIPLLTDMYPDCLVSIYNRLGQLLFRSVGYNKPWDGKYKGIDQPVATYYYVIKPSAELAAVGGSVTILR